MPMRIVIRSYSTVIYLYPSLILAIACGLWTEFYQATPEEPGAAGLVFILGFFFNLTIIAFEYSRQSTFIVILVIVILGLLSTIYPTLGVHIATALEQPLFMETTFYWAWATLLALLLLFVILAARFDYWEVKEKRLFHHLGIMRGDEEFPLFNLKVEKQTNDVMEFILCRAGRLVLTPTGSVPQALDNVPSVNRIVKEINKMLATTQIDQPAESNVRQ